MYLLHDINSDRQTRLLNVFGKSAMFRESFKIRKPSELYSGGAQFEYRLEKTFEDFRFSQSVRANVLIII
jgi:hypothetical protein